MNYKLIKKKILFIETKNYTKYINIKDVVAWHVHDNKLVYTFGGKAFPAFYDKDCIEEIKADEDKELYGELMQRKFSKVSQDIINLWIAYG